jgi:hypothetical protein
MSSIPFDLTDFTTIAMTSVATTTNDKINAAFLATNLNQFFNFLPPALQKAGK